MAPASNSDNQPNQYSSPDTGGPPGPSGSDDGRIAVPVDQLNRVAQVFDAAADDIDAAANRPARDLAATALNGHDPGLSPSSIAHYTAAARESLRRVTSQMRADAGLMAATASDAVDGDSTGPDPDGPSPDQVDRTAGWLGPLARRLGPTPEQPDDPVWREVSRNLEQPPES